MWTIIWTDIDNVDHYARCEDRTELWDYIREMGLVGDEDALIFPPEADELATSPAWLSD